MKESPEFADDVNVEGKPAKPAKAGPRQHHMFRVKRNQLVTLGALAKTYHQLYVTLMVTIDEEGTAHHFGLSE
jgi:hypothetical protein